MIRVVFFSLLINLVVIAQNGSGSFRIYPSTITQTEPIVTINHTNPSMLFVSAVTVNTANGFKSEGVYLSTDAGLTWTGSDTCYGALLVNHGGDPGVAITSNGRLILTHIGSVFPGVYSHYSSDSGKTWTNAYTITNQQTDDKGSSFMDDNINSPYYGRIYTSLVKLLSPYPVFLSYSDNNGESWSIPTQINPTPPQRCIGPSIVINENGKLFASWAAVTTQQPFIEDYISFGYSTDGGTTWSITNNVFDANGINGTLSEKSNIRVNGLPRMAIDKSDGTRKGWLYIVTTDKNISPAGSDPDIILHRSSDNGITWSNGIRVNQDAVNNGKIQYFPAIDIDKNGTINIIYYDDRNTTSDSAEIYLSRSIDGGNTWIDTVLSDHRFKPKPVLGGSSNYQGDYISLIANDDKLHAFWMDDYSGIYQVWTKIIEILPSGIDDKNDFNINEFKLFNNYPNPFNPATKICYSISSTPLSFIKEIGVRLVIYDILGNEIVTLVDEYKTPGKYEVEFNPLQLNLSSGVYFYRLSYGRSSITKSMVYLK